MSSRMLAGYPVWGDRVSGSKDNRLLPFEVQAVAGNLRLIKARWNPDYNEEFLAIANVQYHA